MSRRISCSLRNGSWNLRGHFFFGLLLVKGSDGKGGGWRLEIGGWGQRFQPRPNDLPAAGGEREVLGEDFHAVLRQPQAMLAGIDADR